MLWTVENLKFTEQTIFVVNAPLGPNYECNQNILTSDTSKKITKRIKVCYTDH